jgi:AcrR family transcriptional regulator
MGKRIKIVKEKLIQKLQEMIEDSPGLPGVSARKLAGHFDVQAPSLFRHFENKDEMIRITNEDTLKKLQTALSEAVITGDTSHERLIGFANAYRLYVQENPRNYRLSLNDMTPAWRPQTKAVATFFANLHGWVAELVEYKPKPIAVWCLWAFLHGWVCAETATVFESIEVNETEFQESLNSFITWWISQNASDSS